MSDSKTDKTFYELITEAVNDIAEHGYDRETRLEDWVNKIKRAAQRDLVSNQELERNLRRVLKTTYDKIINGGYKKYHGNKIPKYTIDKLKPKLKPELEKRIRTSLSLIKLNKEKATDDTVRRFLGWASSIPSGGSEEVDKNDVKQNIKRSLKDFSFEERRVMIDQNFKLIASINDVIAKDQGAIAMEWRSNWRQLNYNYRKDHKERDKKIYAIRDSWAVEKGYINKIDGWLDDITQPAVEVYCQCYGVFVYDLDDVPNNGLTAQGKLAANRQNVA